MIECPVCHETNLKESKLCRKCGNVFRRAEPASGRRPLRTVLLIGAAAALPLLALAIWTQANLNLTYYGTKIRDRGPDFRGKDVPMKRIDVRIEDGYLQVPLHVIEEGRLVQFYYPNPVMNLPLIAYVGPTGRLVTAFAWCDPCESAGYHLESNTLVCDKCKTTWALEGDGPQPQARPAHFGFAGNCRLFGPEFVEHELVDGIVRIPESVLRAWRPRQATKHT
jgi:uncharacterized protein